MKKSTSVKHKFYLRRGGVQTRRLRISIKILYFYRVFVSRNPTRTQSPKAINLPNEWGE